MDALERSTQLVRIAAQAASDKQATDLAAFDVSEQLAITDIFLIVTARSEPQVRAVVEAIEQALRAEGVKRARIEGGRDNRWVLIDFLDLVVHVMLPEERSLYALERLWADCPVVELGVDSVDAHNVDSVDAHNVDSVDAHNVDGENHGLNGDSQ